MSGAIQFDGVSTRDIPVIILATAIGLVLIILALAVFFSARSGNPGWSLSLSYKKDGEPPLDQSGSPELPSPQTTEAPSPEQPEHP